MDSQATDVLEAERLVTVEEAARFLCLSRSKVYELVASGRLAAVHIDRNRRIGVRELRAFKDAHTSGGSDNSSAVQLLPSGSHS